LYIGNIIMAGRTEVTTLADQVNEAARIEATARRRGGHSETSMAPDLRDLRT
jgi:class 3 adenylate cyclase